MDNPTLVWECPLCGLETPEPEIHVRVHGMTIDQIVNMQMEEERRVKELARLLMITQEVGEVCMLCGQLIPETHHG